MPGWGGASYFRTSSWILNTHLPVCSGVPFGNVPDRGWTKTSLRYLFLHVLPCFIPPIKMTKFVFVCVSLWICQMHPLIIFETHPWLQHTTNILKINLKTWDCLKIIYFNIILKSYKQIDRYIIIMNDFLFVYTVHK